MTEKMKQTIKTVAKYLGTGLVILAIMFSTISGILWCVSEYKAHHTQYHVYEEMTKLNYHATKLELVNAVDAYIQKTASSACLNGIAVVDACVDNDIDICFVLAQGENESHFGTAGLARKTNSVWNVFAYDGQGFEQISSKGKYKSPDDSVLPYIHLLKKRYMYDNKTEYDLLSNFVDKDGNRYASSKNYEDNLRKKYDSIRSSTPIDSLSLELKKLAMILGY